MPRNLTFAKIALDHDEEELDQLVKLVKEQQPPLGKSMLIFCDKKSRVALVCEALKKAGFPGLPYDESMSSQARNLSLSLLRAGKLPIMVSDKAAQRGLDLVNVDHVVQFDFARSNQDFLQRVGRTGRLGAPGKVTNFIRPRDTELFQKIMDRHSEGKRLEVSLTKKQRKV